MGANGARHSLSRITDSRRCLQCRTVQSSITSRGALGSDPTYADTQGRDLRDRQEYVNQMHNCEWQRLPGISRQEVG
eukprot:scaffold103442_cov52-Attheya_sp.AAC.4